MKRWIQRILMKGISDSSLWDKHYYWLSLRMVKGIGNALFLSLIDRFGSPDRVFEAGEDALVDAGIRKEIAHRIAKKEFVSDPEKELDKLRNIGARIITYDDEEYPELLKEIDYPPVLLYAMGKRVPRDQLHISIVGSRNASQYGLRTAQDLSFRLAKIGLGIISGMARGIDAFAHKGALRAGGYTGAVLGTGIDVVYPKENKALFQKIKEHGTIITEFPLGTPPEPKNFPVRNRIISGISRGVLVVEAAKRSGSLITASFGLNQGREIFAVPGSIESLRSKGCHFLIKQGAKLVEDIYDIIEEFGIELTGESRDEHKASAHVRLDPKEKRIYECLSEYPVHIDEIIRNTNLDAAEVLSSLLKLELKGIVVQMPGKMFLKGGKR